jgi:hypothetical protein
VALRSMPIRARTAHTPAYLWRQEGCAQRVVHGDPGGHAAPSGQARFYQRLCQAGKPRKVAIVAAMRKLLTILGAILRQQKPWDPAVHTSAS